MLTLVKPALLVFLTAVLLILAGPVAAAPEAITLPAEAPAQRSVELQEQWRIGGDDDEDVLLGVIGRGALGSDGNTYLLDSQLSQVLVISPAGELITILGREGEGPGEFANASDLFVRDDGVVGVNSGMPSRIVLINGDNTPAGRIELMPEGEQSGFIFSAGLVLRDGNLVMQNGRGVFDMEAGKMKSTMSLVRLDQQGQELTRYVTHEQESDFARHVFDEEKEFSELNVWTFGHDHVYTVPGRETYTINVRDLDGELVQVISRKFKPRKRTKEDKEDISSGRVVIMNGVRQEIENKILDTDMAIQALHVGDDGRLLVATCFDQGKLLPDGTAGRFDVISPAGDFVEQLMLTVPDFDGIQDRLIFLGGGNFLVIRNLDSAQDARRAGFDGADPDEEVEDVEPLEVIFYSLP